MSMFYNLIVSGSDINSSWTLNSTKKPKFNIFLRSNKTTFDIRTTGKLSVHQSELRISVESGSRLDKKDYFRCVSQRIRSCACHIIGLPDNTSHA